MPARTLILAGLLAALSYRLYWPDPALSWFAAGWSVAVSFVHYLIERSGRTGLLRAFFFGALAVFFISCLQLGNAQETRFSPYCHLSLAGNILHVGYNQLLAATGGAWYRYGALSVGLGWFLIIVAAGGAFCGWVCFFGGVDDSLSRIPRRPVLKLPAGLKARQIQAALLLFFAYLSFIHFEPLFCKWACPFKAANEILNENSKSFAAQTFAYAVVGIVFLVLLPLLTGKRTFCSFICPFGAIPPLLRGILPYRIRINPDRCTACKRCVDSCPSFAMREREGGVGPNRYCTLCMRCEEVCKRNAISLGTSVRAKSRLPAFVSMCLGGSLSLFYVPGGMQSLMRAIQDLAKTP